MTGAQLASSWGVHLVHATWQSAAAAGALLLAVRALPRLPSRLRYALLLIALVKFALPPMLALPPGLFSAAPGVGSSFFWPAERVFVLGNARAVAALAWLHLIGGVAVAALLAVRAAQLRRLIRRAAPAEERVLALAGLIAARLGLRRLPRIFVSPEATSPFACGTFSPAIVVPLALARRGRLADVLAHELAHVAAHDARDRAAEALLAAVWWWNPLYWLLCSELGRVREERCDDAVLALALSTPRHYSLTIIEAAAAAGARHAGVAMAAHPLEPRLRRLADPSLARRRKLTWLQLGVVLAAALLLLPGVRPRFSRAAPFHARAR